MGALNSRFPAPDHLIILVLNHSTLFERTNGMSSLYYLYVDTFSILWTLSCRIFSSSAELTIYQELIGTDILSDQTLKLGLT